MDPNLGISHELCIPLCSSVSSVVKDFLDCQNRTAQLSHLLPSHPLFDANLGTARVLQLQKLLHLLQCLVQRPLKGSAAWPRASEAQLVLQLAIGYLQIGPAQHLLAP